MKKIFTFLFFVIAFWSCEEKTDTDTIPPTISVTSHQPGQIVSEVITIIVVSEDNEGIGQLEFYLDNDLVQTYTSPPYEFKLNTVQYDDGHTLSIKVKSIDINDNTAEAEFDLIVNNSFAAPQESNVNSVTYTLTEMTVEWDESTDGDFRDYKLLYSQAENGSRDTITVYTNRTTVSHTITEFDPLVENWFWVLVTDTLGLSSIGSGMTNPPHSSPNPVNVTSVIYDLESMTITWEVYLPNVGRILAMNQSTGTTVTNDFISYELLQSNSYGDSVSVVVVDDIGTTSHTITEFDPTQQNWFNVKVTDFWGQSSIGNGMTQGYYEGPSPINITSVMYDADTMTITWEQSDHWAFASYTLRQSIGNDWTFSSLAVINDISATAYSITEFDPSVPNYFYVLVTDVWGVENVGNYISNEINVEPEPVSITSIDYDTESMSVTWEQSNIDDFASYELKHSDSWDGTYTSVAVITDQSITSYAITEFDPLVTNWFKVNVTDLWGLTRESDIMSSQIDGPPTVCNIVQVIYANDSLDISWNMSEDWDFSSYTLYESDNEYMNNKLEVFTSNNIADTSVSLNIDENLYRYYQLDVEDVFGNVTESDISMGYSSIVFQHTFSIPTIGRTVRQTDDKGYIIVGYTNEIGAGGYDIILIKTDAYGNEEWSQTIGGGSDDKANSLEIAQDGGYIITGNTESFGAGESDIWLIKTDQLGQVEWSPTFGDSTEQIGYSAKPTSSGGYIVCGSSLLINTDDQGNIIWENSYDFTLRSVVEHDDGGYVIAGYEYFGDPYWNDYLVLVKANADGEIEWETSYAPMAGEDIDYYGHYISKTSDNGFVVTGYRYLPDEVLLLKYDSEGQIEWTQTFDTGGMGWGIHDAGYSVEQSLDGGYIIAAVNGWSNRAWLIKTDPQGNLEWQINDSDVGSSAYSAQQTDDGGYICTGSRFLLKTGPDGYYIED